MQEYEETRFTRKRRGIVSSYRKPAAEELERRHLLAADLPPLVDINTLPSRPGASHITEILHVDGTTFFTTSTALHGQELWKTDGTATGTELVKDIVPGKLGSGISQLTEVDGTLYFVAVDPVHRYTVWKSDGTEEGTFPLPLEDDLPRVRADALDLIAVNDTLFFRRGPTIWKSDGTEAGTLPVAEQKATALTSFDDALFYRYQNRLWKIEETGSSPIQVSEVRAREDLVVANGAIYFQGNDFQGAGWELWKSDGTEAGTSLVADIAAEGLNSFPHAITEHNGDVYFRVGTGSAGHQLWKTDGTEVGTEFVHEAFFIKHLESTAEYLFFVDLGGGQLWRTNGTQDGTVLVRDFFSIDYKELTGVGDQVYFAADGELWISDGTSSGTFEVKDIYPGNADSNPSTLTNANGELFFSAFDGVHGYELWKSQGTADTTMMVVDLKAASADASPYSLTAVNDKLYFTAIDGRTGVWLSDGTQLGTRKVKTGLGYSFTELHGEVYFTGEDTEIGGALWKTDGTEAGTVLVKDHRENDSGSFSREMIRVGDNLFFTDDGFTLWVSDGTTSGTRKLETVASNLTDVNDTLFYFDSSGLWKIENVDDGSQLVKSFGENFFYQIFEEGIVVEDLLYFVASDGLRGEELWRSDGTEAGTWMVKDIYTSNACDVFSCGSSPTQLTDVDGTLFFCCDG